MNWEALLNAFLCVVVIVVLVSLVVTGVEAQQPAMPIGWKPEPDPCVQLHKEMDVRRDILKEKKDITGVAWSQDLELLDDSIVDYLDCKARQ